MQVLKIISSEPLTRGCVLNEEEWKLDPNAPEDELGNILSLFVGRTVDGHYIGNEETTLMLLSRGIQPELRTPTSNVCSIGFCENENKWYGWSHRAIYGFGIGSVTKKGDIAYAAKDADEYGEQMLNFICDDPKIYLDRKWEPSQQVNSFDGATLDGVLTSWVYSDTVENEKLRGIAHSTFWPYPETWGRGEWEAQTMEDAKQMAMDFAEAIG